MCDLGFLGFDLGFNLGFSMVLNGIFEGFLDGLGFRVLRGFWFRVLDLKKKIQGFEANGERSTNSVCQNGVSTDAPS